MKRDDRMDGAGFVGVLRCAQDDSKNLEATATEATATAKQQQRQGYTQRLNNGGSSEGWVGATGFSPGSTASGVKVMPAVHALPRMKANPKQNGLLKEVSAGEPRCVNGTALFADDLIDNPHPMSSPKAGR